MRGEVGPLSDDASLAGDAIEDFDDMARSPFRSFESLPFLLQTIVLSLSKSDEARRIVTA
jgi:hypothetical protein